jgi:hypothetical protein
MEAQLSPGSFRLKQSVYALQDPAAPGLFIRIQGERPKLKPLHQACIAPATEKGLEWLAKRASCRLQGCVYDVVRVDK